MIELRAVPGYNTAVISQLISDAITAQGHGAQTKLAQVLGVRVQTVNKWAQGQTNPHPERWAEVEEALGIEPGTFAQVSGLTAPGGRAPAASDRLEALEARMGNLETQVRRLVEQLVATDQQHRSSSASV